MVGLFTISGPLNNQITLIIECKADGQAALISLNKCRLLHMIILERVGVV